MNNNIDSKIISFLRFPMIIGIVLIHSGVELNYNYTQYPIYNYVVNNGIIGTFTRICVPLFFMISGYLFYYKLNDLNIKTYLYKLTRRIHSLFIPYVFWNSLAICLFFVMDVAFPRLKSGATPPLSDISTFFSLYWMKKPDLLPIVPQFWFIRNLMIIVVLTPVIYWLINRLKLLIVLFWGILWVLHIYEFMIPGTMALFFFTLGAYFSINYKKISDFAIKNKWVGFPYPLFALFDIITKNQVYNIYIHNIAILSGMIFVINLLLFIINKKSNFYPSKTLLASTFFIFAAHEPYMGKFKTVCYKILPTISLNKSVADIQFLIYYIFVAALWIILLITVYCCLNKISNKFTLFITGGR